jgi:hypothetical protein
MKKFLIGFGVLVAPAVALAQTTNDSQLFSILGIVQRILNVLIPIIITIGVLYVIWGIISFVTKTNEEERAKAKSVIVYGVIGLAAITMIWGLVGFLSRTLGIGVGGTAVVPCVVDTDNNPYNGCQY